MMKYDLKDITGRFDICGDYVSGQSYGTGHINDTFAITYSQPGCQVRYVLQRINHSIFKDPPALMDNMVRVTRHIRMSLENAGVSDVDRRVLRVILTHDGTSCYQDAEGNYWRLLNLITDVESYDYIHSPLQAYQAAKAFGQFQRFLSDFPKPKLNETIPDFHNTPQRMKAFMQVLDQDPQNRACRAHEEIQFVLDHASMCDGLLKWVETGEIPERITHNDTKINNVLFDPVMKEGICVIDLDTVMPGLSLYDFGDMVRTATCQAAEDEQDLSKIHLDISFFEQLARGYLSETADFLTPAEKEHLVFAGKLITFEQMIRFLGDYLAGDVYYKVHRPGHNLDRARTQMKLIQSLLNQEDQMLQLVEDICKRQRS